MYLLKQPDEIFWWIHDEFGEVDMQAIYYSSEIQGRIEVLPLAKMVHPNIGLFCVEESDDYIRWWMINDDTYIISVVNTLDKNNPGDSALNLLDLCESLAEMMPGEMFYLYTPNGDTLELEVLPTTYEIDNSALYYLAESTKEVEVPKTIQTYNCTNGIMDLFLDRIKKYGIDSLRPKDKQFLDKLSHAYFTE